MPLQIISYTLRDETEMLWNEILNRSKIAIREVCSFYKCKILLRCNPNKIFPLHTHINQTFSHFVVL